MSTRLRDALHSGRILLMDGAMGTELQRRGMKDGECYELWNLTRPDDVKAIHQSYADVGTKIFVTNSFQANPRALGKRDLKDRLPELNSAAVRLAREVAGPERFVLGSIGPWPKPNDDDLHAVLNSLTEADAWLLETRSERGAFQEAKKARDLDATKPVILSFAFRKTGSGCQILTYDDLTPEACAGSAERAGCTALGMNCGNEITLDDSVQIIRRYRSATQLPLFVRPNAGTPKRVGDEYVYPVTPEQLASRLPELLDAGATMVGGCCGTTPEHIAAMRVVVEEWNRRLVR